MYHTGNFYLSLDQMKDNALYLYGLLNNEGWTLNAIAGLLGNTQTESTHNPGIWQNLKEGVGPGYGLTQWTPYTKYTLWCSENGIEPSEMESAVSRLVYEVEHPSEQWVTHSRYPLTFPQFTQSEETPYYLAITFLNNYEMPGNLNQPQRGKQAEYWYEYLSGEEPPDPKPWIKTYSSKSILVPLLKGGRAYGSNEQRRSRRNT